MIDIDNFKALNDRFGHEAGDLVLAAVGELIVDTTRSEDIACRYGGEEFAIILVGADANLAREVGERLCDSIRHLPLSFHGQTPTSVTISAGIAVLAGEDTSPSALLRSADEMLYHAKQAGRGRVRVANSKGGE
jgi:diguanylate cyclase (GGDEF)-like protein